MQAAIPPPKYDVSRLIPSSTKVPSSDLSAMVVIHRDGLSERRLPVEEATATLISNTDDAFGFPPYSLIEEFFLKTLPGGREREESIFRECLQRVPGIELGSQNLDWAERIDPILRSIPKSE